MLICTISI